MSSMARFERRHAAINFASDVMADAVVTLDVVSRTPVHVMEHAFAPHTLRRPFLAWVDNYYFIAKSPRDGAALLGIKAPNHVGHHQRPCTVNSYGMHAVSG